MSKQLVRMYSLKKMQVISKLGHSAIFEASRIGDPEPKLTAVHPSIVDECLARGAVVHNAEDQPFQDDATKVQAALSGKLRTSLLYLVMQRIVNRNNPKDFNSGTIPLSRVVAEMTTFDVSDKEVKKAWQEFRAAENSGTDLNIDPRAQRAMDIIDASNVSELSILADEMGVEKDDYVGLTTRDLKQFLLAKFA